MEFFVAAAAANPRLADETAAHAICSAARAGAGLLLQRWPWFLNRSCLFSSCLLLRGCDVRTTRHSSTDRAVWQDRTISRSNPAAPERSTAITDNQSAIHS